MTAAHPKLTSVMASHPAVARSIRGILPGVAQRALPTVQQHLTTHFATLPEKSASPVAFVEERLDGLAHFLDSQDRFTRTQTEQLFATSLHSARAFAGLCTTANLFADKKSPTRPWNSLCKRSLALIAQRLTPGAQGMNALESIHSHFAQGSSSFDTLPLHIAERIVLAGFQVWSPPIFDNRHMRILARSRAGQRALFLVRDLRPKHEHRRNRALAQAGHSLKKDAELLRKVPGYENLLTGIILAVPDSSGLMGEHRARLRYHLDRNHFEVAGLFGYMTNAQGRMTGIGNTTAFPLI